MTYKIFRTKLMESVSSEIDERGLKDISLKFETINSPDGMNDRLTVSVTGSNMGMSFRIKEIFKDYEDGEPLSVASHKIVNTIEQNLSTVAKGQEVTSLITDYSKVKDKLFLRVIPSKYASDCPKKLLEDIAIVTSIHLDSLSDPNDRAVILVSTDLMHALEIDEATLFADAEANSLAKEPIVIKPLAETIKHLLNEDDPKPKETGIAAYVVSNQSGFLGASVLAYPDFADKIAKTIGASSFTILPSSVHELIVISGSDNVPKAKDFNEMIKNVNKTMQPRDILSNQCYHFDVKKRKFETGLDHENSNKQEYVYDLFNDYSYLEFRDEFVKCSLQDIVNDTGNYHSLTILDAGMALNILNKLPITEYFKFTPECLEDLRNLPEFNSLKNDITSLTVGDCFTIICGVKDDFSEDYSAKDFYIEAASIMLKPIIDSGFDHPLFSNYIKHIYEAAYLSTGEECFESGMLNERLQDVSINGFMRKHYDKHPGLCSQVFFNHIIRPAFGLAREKRRLHPER